MNDVWLVMRGADKVDVWHVTGAQAYDERVAAYEGQIEALGELARLELPAGIAEAEAFTDIIAGAAVQLAWPADWADSGPEWTASLCFGEPHHTVLAAATVHEQLPELPAARELYPL